MNMIPCCGLVGGIVYPVCALCVSMETGRRDCRIAVSVAWSRGRASRGIILVYGPVTQSIVGMVYSLFLSRCILQCIQKAAISIFHLLYRFENVEMQTADRRVICFVDPLQMVISQ